MQLGNLVAISYLTLLSLHWNIQTADLCLEFWIHLKMRELDPFRDHNHEDCDDFN